MGGKGRLRFCLFHLPLLLFEVLHSLDNDFRVGNKIIADAPLKGILWQRTWRARRRLVCLEPRIKQIPGTRSNDQQQGQENKTEVAPYEIQLLHDFSFPPLEPAREPFPPTLLDLRFRRVSALT